VSLTEFIETRIARRKSLHHLGAGVPGGNRTHI
jgi:hypothetical protein